MFVRSRDCENEMSILIGSCDFTAELLSTAATTVPATTEAATTMSAVVTTARPSTTTTGKA